MKKKESWKIFQSTPSYEGELCFGRCQGLGKDHFNPLPHTRENGKNKDSDTDPMSISIHSLIRGRTSTVKRLSKSLTFQSTPSYEGERPNDKIRIVAKMISIHSLIRGRTRQKSQEKISQTFQSTPSYEGELNIYTHLDSIYKFQSTPSYEGEQCSRRMSRGYSKFQSTPSYEGEQ